MDPPYGTKLIGYKWVFENKYRSDGSLDKQKARLVGKGFAQKEGVDHELTSFKEATSHDEWKESMQKEHEALIKNGTWKFVDPPFGTKPISCKWVLKNT